MRLSWIVIAILVYRAKRPIAMQPPQVIVVAAPSRLPRAIDLGLECPPNGPCFQPCMTTNAGCWSY